MARVEILTGRERRRVWSVDQKLAILEEASAGHLTVVEIARRHDVIPQQIYAWRRKLAQAVGSIGAPATATFLPVTLMPSDGCPGGELEKTGTKEPRASQGSATVSIRCKGGRVLTVAAGLDPTLLQVLIRSVETA